MFSSHKITYDNIRLGRKNIGFRMMPVFNPHTSKIMMSAVKQPPHFLYKGQYQISAMTQHHRHDV